MRQDRSGALGFPIIYHQPGCGREAHPGFRFQTEKIAGTDFECVEVVQLIRTANVLIVEDDYGIRTVLKALLSAAGMHVDEATNCDDGLKRTAATDYGVIILDWRVDCSELSVRPPIEETEGHLFIKALGAQCERTGKRPMVIAMTAADSEEWTEDDMIALTFRKPFNARDLVDVVHRYVANLTAT